MIARKEKTQKDMQRREGHGRKREATVREKEAGRGV